GSARDDQQLVLIRHERVEQAGDRQRAGAGGDERRVVRHTVALEKNLFASVLVEITGTDAQIVRGVVTDVDAVFRAPVSRADKEPALRPAGAGGRIGIVQV